MGTALQAPYGDQSVRPSVRDCTEHIFSHLGSIWLILHPQGAFGMPTGYSTKKKRKITVKTACTSDNFKAEVLRNIQREKLELKKSLLGIERKKLDFDLVCDQAYLAELIQAVLMAGQIAGAVFVSPVCDRMGRKTVHLSCNLLTLIIGISAAFAPNYTTLVILKFILGVLQQVFIF
uniref:Solute carrier family 22 member 13 n=1 Tax=Magallana gigas TaxID=29159 RepID=K1R829_MAGGI